MLRLWILCVVMGLCAATTTLSAAGELGVAVKQSTLANLALSALRPVSDQEGTSVRGKFTFAHVGGAVNGTPLSTINVNAFGGKLALGAGVSGGAFSGAIAFAK